MSTMTIDNPTEIGVRNVATNRGEMRGDVSREWFTRPDDQKFLNLSDLLAYTRAKADASKSVVVSNRDVEVLAPAQEHRTDQHKLFARLPDGTEANFSHWSFGQVSGLAGAPAKYLRTLPSPLVADNLTWGLHFNREVEQVKSYYQPGGEMMLRALTGPDYGRIFDHEIVQAVMDIAGEGLGENGWKVPGVMNWSTGQYNPHVDVTKENTTLFASDRDVFIFLVDDLHPIEVGKLPDGSPDLLFRGFYIKNSEVGRTSCVIATFYLRGVCMNRLLWGVEHFDEVRIIHSKSAPDRFVQEATPALQSFSQGSVQRLQEGVQLAKEAKIASDDEEAMAFLRNRNFNRKQAATIMETVEREEGHPMRSAWDAAQGITAVARRIPHTDDRIDLELKAGAILNKVAA